MKQHPVKQATASFGAVDQSLSRLVQWRRHLASRTLDAVISLLPSSFTSRIFANRISLFRECILCLESGAPLPQIDQSDDEIGAVITELARAASFIRDRVGALEAALQEGARASRNSGLASIQKNSARTEFVALMQRVSQPLNTVFTTADLLASTPLNEEQQRCVSAMRSKSRELKAIFRDTLDLPTMEAIGLRTETSHVQQGHSARSVAESPTVLSETLPVVEPNIKDGGCGNVNREISQVRGTSCHTANPLAGAKLLLLDSKEDQRLALRQFLVGNHAEVEEADGALEALLTLAQATEKGDPFSLAIIDGRLSRVTGLDTARRILGQEWAARLPIVLLTCGLSPDDLEDVDSLPVRCFNGPLSDTSGLLAELEAVLAGQPRRNPAFVSRSLLRQILIIDDNAINLFLASDFLKDMEGFEVETAEGGEAGLERALSKRFDLILMDMQMPVVDGQTATREIRRHEIANGLNRMPIIAFTAHSAASELEAARQAGCDAYLIKPTKREKMIASVLSFVQPTLRRATVLPQKSVPKETTAFGNIWTAISQNWPSPWNAPRLRWRSRTSKLFARSSTSGSDRLQALAFPS